MAVYGIDLGSTYSRIAKVDESGRAVVLPNALGEHSTPSVVYFESAQSVLVGQEAKDAAAIAPDRVVAHIKRQMGTDFRYTVHGPAHTPASICALILRELASAAQERTEEAVRDVVITVPAYYGLLEREATLKAGQLAGLNVLDMLPEPVAAVLSYQAWQESTQPRHIFVYDLGGGTFNVTVMQLTNDEARIVCTDGDQHLGGLDWDTRIANFLLHAFQDQHPELDPSDDQQFMWNLTTSAEQLKRALSHTSTRTQAVRFGGSVVKVELTRNLLEEITSELLERTMEITGRTIATAREMGIDRFDQVLLVGGMNRMPVIATTLRERFGIEPEVHEPDEAVAKGAALYENILSLKSAEQAGLDAAQAVAAAIASSALVPFIQALAAKAAEDVYSTLRSLGCRIRPRNKKSPMRTGSIVYLANEDARLILELPPILSGSDQETLHRLLKALVSTKPSHASGWLNLSRSDQSGWSVRLIDSVPPGSIMLEHSQSARDGILAGINRSTRADGERQEQGRVVELEREVKLLREMVRYLASEMNP